MIEPPTMAVTMKDAPSLVRSMTNQVPKQTSREMTITHSRYFGNSMKPRLTAPSNASGLAS